MQVRFGPGWFGDERVAGGLRPAAQGLVPADLVAWDLVPAGLVTLDWVGGLGSGGSILKIELRRG